MSETDIAATRSDVREFGLRAPLRAPSRSSVQAQQLLTEDNLGRKNDPNPSIVENIQTCWHPLWPKKYSEFFSKITADCSRQWSRSEGRTSWSVQNQEVWDQNQDTQDKNGGWAKEKIAGNKFWRKRRNWRNMVVREANLTISCPTEVLVKRKSSCQVNWSLANFGGHFNLVCYMIMSEINHLWMGVAP